MRGIVAFAIVIQALSMIGSNSTVGKFALAHRFTFSNSANAGSATSTVSAPTTSSTLLSPTATETQTATPTSTAPTYQQPVIETGSALGSRAILNYNFPRLGGEPFPTVSTPTVTAAETDTPTPYKDRCHVQQNLTSTKSSCVYGFAKSKTTIVLFGDSHALSWFPAIEQIAIKQRWKLVSLTMSSCWPSSIPAWNAVTNTLMKNCTIWRTATLKKISTLHPYITFVAGTRGFETIDSKGNVLKGNSRAGLWIKGMNTTLTSLHQSSRNLVYLSDYPVSAFAPGDCLELAPSIVDVCGTYNSSAININWLNTERIVALNNGAIWINPTEWLCNTEPCNPFMNGYIIYRDTGHLTSTFARTLAVPLWETLNPVLLAANTSVPAAAVQPSTSTNNTTTTTKST